MDESKHEEEVADMVCEGNMTALLGEAALFIPRYECNSPVAPSDFNAFTTENLFYGQIYLKLV